MLIVNIVFFVFAACFAAKAVTSIDTSVSAVTSTKLKRATVDPDDDTRNNQEKPRGTQSTISSLQDINSRSLSHYRKAKATDTQKVSHTNPHQRSGSHAYGSVPKQPFSYASSPIQQTELHQSSLLAPYFDILTNPNTYKATTSPEKPLEASKSIVSPSLQKLQGVYSPAYSAFHPDKSFELSDFSDFEYPSYSGISKIIDRGIQNDASSPTAAVPVYKSAYLPKVNEHASSFPIISSVSPLFQSSEKVKQNSEHNHEATVDVKGKKVSLPIVQLQSNPDLSGVFPAFDSQPFLLSSNYPIESDLGFSFGDGPKFKAALQSSSKNPSPFLSPLSSFQGQVVPIQTASSTPQFPQYKGASIEIYPVSSNVPKVQGSYESLYSQPQLHFGKGHGGQPANTQQNIVHPSVSTEDILEDVEIVDKKNPEPHPSQTDDDKDDERFKIPEKENSSEDDAEPGKYFKEPLTESDFKPSKSFPFKEYDETFRKYKTQTDDDDSEDKPNSSYTNYPASVNDEEEDSSSEHRSEYIESSKPSHGSYEEDEEEEETRRHERREDIDEDPYEVEPKQSEYYGKDFEQEFEESYREELPKHKYVHVKEVPDIDSNNNPIPPRRQSKNDKRSRVNHELSEESRSRESRVSRKNRKIPKTTYRDSAAYGSDVSFKKTPKVIYEEFFRYKHPETGKYSKHAKTDATIEKYSSVKKSPTENSYLRAAKYYKSKSPKTGGGFAKKQYSSAKNWKSDKTSVAETAPRSNVRRLSDPGDRASSYVPSAVSGQARSLTNAEIFRDLTGI